MKRALLLAMAAAMTLASCAAKETTTPPAGTPSSSTTAAGVNTPGSSASGPTSAPGTTQKPGCAMDLKIVNASAASEATLTDRKLDVKTAWSDEGPHPDNTVDYDKSLDVAIAEFVIEKDPQFGYSIPIGDPSAPEGKVYVALTLSATDGKIAAGQTYVGSTSDEKADGTVTTHFMYAGSARLLPAEPTVTVTEITDDYVCGEIKSQTKTDLQSFIGVEGTFKVTRIQSLEAAEDK